MPSTLFSLVAGVADQALPALPFRRRQDFDEFISFTFDQATHGSNYVAVPCASIGSIQAIILWPDQAITVRWAAQTDGGVAVAAGGCLALFNTTIDNAGGTGVTIKNASGSTVTVRALVAGT